MKFNEYQPKGGWIKYRKRKALKERVLTAFGCFFIVGAYAFIGFIENCL